MCFFVIKYSWTHIYIHTRIMLDIHRGKESNIMLYMYLYEMGIERTYLISSTILLEVKAVRPMIPLDDSKLLSEDKTLR